MNGGTTIILPYPTLDVGYLPAFVAQSKGIFKDEGLNVKLIPTNGAKQGIELLVKKHIDFVMTIGPAIRSGPKNIKIVTQMINKPVFSLVALPACNQVTDLDKKDIGVDDNGMTRILLEKLNQLWKISMVLRDIDGVDEKLIALTQNQTSGISGALFTPPMVFKALRLGFKRLAFVGDLLPESPVTGLVTTEDYIATNRDTVERMVSAISRAVLIVRHDPETTLAVMKGPLAMEPDEAKQTYYLIRKHFSSYVSSQGLKETIAMAGGGQQPVTYMEPGFPFLR